MPTEMMQMLQRGMTSGNSYCLLSSVWMLLSVLSAMKTESAVSNVTPAHTFLRGKTATINCDYNKSNETVFFGVALSREKLLCSYFYQYNSWKNQSCSDNIRFIWTPETAGVSFELLNLQINQSGVYTCAVERHVPPPVTQLGLQTTFIHVLGRPAVSTSCVKGSDGAPTLLCTSEGFYPAALELVWIRDGEFITHLNNHSLTNREYLNSSNIQWNSSINTDGSHSLTSYLHLPATPEQVLYRCWVNHSSLSQPITVNISSTECYRKEVVMLTDLLLIVTGVTSAVLTIIVVILAVHCHRHRRRRTCTQSPVGRPFITEREPNPQPQYDVYSTLGNHQPVPCRNNSNCSTTPSLQQTLNH